MIDNEMLFKLVPWIISCISIIGGLFNAFGKTVGFVIWIIANISWIIFDIYTMQYAQIPMWAVYTITSAIGIYIWRKHKINSIQKEA